MDPPPTPRRPPQLPRARPSSDVATPHEPTETALDRSLCADGLPIRSAVPALRLEPGVTVRGHGCDCSSKQGAWSERITNYIYIHLLSIWHQGAE